MNLNFYIARNNFTPFIEINTEEEISRALVQFTLPTDEYLRDDLELLVMGCVEAANYAVDASIPEKLKIAASHCYTRSTKMTSTQEMVYKGLLEVAGNFQG